MSDYKGDERRRFKRVKVGITVFYRQKDIPQVRIRSEEGEKEAMMLDISEGGMAITAEVEFPVHTTIWVRFTLSYHEEEQAVNFFGHMELLGEIRSCEKLGNNSYRLGIAFSNIDHKIKQNLQGFVELVESRLKQK